MRSAFIVNVVCLFDISFLSLKKSVVGLLESLGVLDVVSVE
jgi:hypothetical protein